MFKAMITAVNCAIMREHNALWYDQAALRTKTGMFSVPQYQQDGTGPVFQLVKCSRRSQLGVPPLSIPHSTVDTYVLTIYIRSRR